MPFPSGTLYPSSTLYPEAPPEPEFVAPTIAPPDGLPHLDFPFRFVTSREGKPQAAYVQQDSSEDVRICIECVLRTPLGYRPEEPGYGYSDPTFNRVPLSTDSVYAAVSQWEPRAVIEAEEYGDAIDAAVRNIRVEIETRGQ